MTGRGVGESEVEIKRGFGAHPLSPEDCLEQKSVDIR